MRSGLYTWRYQGSLKELYAHYRFWFTRAWREGNLSTSMYASRYRKVVGEEGEISLVSISDDPKQPTHRLERLVVTSGGSK